MSNIRVSDTDSGMGSTMTVVFGAANVAVGPLSLRSHVITDSPYNTSTLLFVNKAQRVIAGHRHATESVESQT